MYPDPPRIRHRAGIIIAAPYSASPLSNALKAKPSPPLKLSTLHHTAATAALVDTVDAINEITHLSHPINALSTHINSHARGMREVDTSTSAFAEGSGWDGGTERNGESRLGKTKSIAYPARIGGFQSIGIGVPVSNNSLSG
ncbi:hypothetical protein R3P38DRAFT_3203686 [Favolaschia claudopus]|uniref:Uncharacterized protein n=1 Tax=Favolaschia claudopus TaxID=2862362 RepID=A0AAW0ASD0_9AGAR